MNTNEDPVSSGVVALLTILRRNMWVTQNVSSGYKLTGVCLLWAS